MFRLPRTGHRMLTEDMPYYAVCTECDFLRVLSTHARETALPEDCPACGSSLVLQQEGSRFEPTYVSRVSRSLHDAPTIDHAR